MYNTKIAPFYKNYEIVERNYANLDWFIALFAPAAVVEVVTLVFVLRHSSVLASIFSQVTCHGSRGTETIITSFTSFTVVIVDSDRHTPRK